MKLPYHYDGAQLARGIVAIQEGREIDPILRMAIDEMPKEKTPLELEVERLRDELEQARSTQSDFVVAGFNDHME